MPLDPGVNFGSDLKNSIANKIYSNKKYNQSYFLLLNDGTSYSAYIMTIMADSAYVNNDLSKLRHNSYRKHDPDFSGMVLYFTPKGRYLGGYLYQNGQLISPGSSNQTAHAAANKTAKPIIDVSTPPVCTDWFLDYYLNGQLIFSTYIGTTCSSGSSGGSSGTGSGGNSPGGGGGGPPPPPACNVNTTSSTKFTGHFTTDVAQPPPGGYPPPTDPCTTKIQPDTTKNPCLQAVKLAAMEANAIISNENAQIFAITTNGTNQDEYGTSQNLTSWPGSTYKDVPLTTSGLPDQFTPAFSWDATNGYTIGISHGHPYNSAPSYLDAFIMLKYLSNSNLVAAGPSAVQFYKSNVSLTTITLGGNYVITVNSWSALQTVYNQYTTQWPRVFAANYQQLSDAYQRANPNATLAEAGEISAFTNIWKRHRFI